MAVFARIHTRAQYEPVAGTPIVSSMNVAQLAVVNVMCTEFVPLCAFVLSLTTVTVLAATELSTVQPAPSIALLSNPSQNTAPAGQAPPPSPEPPLLPLPLLLAP